MFYQNQIRNALVALLFFLTVAVFAQSTGKIVGKIVDAETNEAMPGVNVVVLDTQTGAASDLDGNYLISNLAPGEYNLRFTFISYTTVNVDKVTVRPGRETKIDIALRPSVLEMGEVVVAAEALKTSEFSVLNVQKNANYIVDGISAELISRNNSSDGTDVLKRMTGVTISEGKYAFVRGVGDRYNNTLLNGASLPSTDPEKKSFSYDLFPANLIESLLTAKTATPDKPGDFSGGLIEMNTVEFPTSLTFGFSASTYYDPQTTMKDFVGYSGGRKDVWGIDDGTRAMPSLINDQKVGRGNYNSEELKQIGLAFPNNWQTETHRSPIKGSYKLSFGNSHLLGNNMLGYITSLNYSNSDAVRNLEKNNYTFDGPRYEFVGTNYSNSVSWSGMANVSLKLGKGHKFSSKNLYNLNSDNETIEFEGTHYLAPDHRKTTSLSFVKRTLYSSQLTGDHRFKLMKGLTWNWNLSYSHSERDEPDTRRYLYSKDPFDSEAEFRFLLDQSLSTRFFGKLDDTARGGKTDLLIKLSSRPSFPDLKIGFLYDDRNRQFNARTFGFWNIPGGNFIEEDRTMFMPVEEIFRAENFGNRFIEIVEITKPADSYASQQYINAGYLMTSFNMFTKLKVVTGVRYEHSRQNMDSFTITNEPVSIRATYSDWLPSVNLAWGFNPKTSLRAAFSKTLARPEFRELAPFSYFDFLNYELVEGNPNLKRSVITNYDLRFEYYPTNLDLFAVSAFYKAFNDPIEQILLAASGHAPIRSFENADRAVNYGVEFELKKGLSFIGPWFYPFSFVGNLSLIHSEINLTGDKEFQQDKRPLQGQADFIANAGLYYENMNGKLAVALIYNKVGERIHSVGFANLGDVIELPKDQIDFSVSAKVVDNVKLKIAMKDILNQDHKFVQRTLEGDKPAEISRRGRIVTAGLSYQF